ncbi:hypothetical protein E2C01_022113 [Portunus trituberculatus]|uniref:Uncharacterized protein n=1 Tax=Portunus trituberculatus TaxID=210409 RepID=A0A5B7E4J3_PORTR|nr:hypothetical protein [Portunus trituberculatus]
MIQAAPAVGRLCRSQVSVILPGAATSHRHAPFMQLLPVNITLPAPSRPPPGPIDPHLTFLGQQYGSYLRVAATLPSVATLVVLLFTSPGAGLTFLPRHSPVTFFRKHK